MNISANFPDTASLKMFVDSLESTLSNSKYRDKNIPVDDQRNQFILEIINVPPEFVGSIQSLVKNCGGSHQ
ncbi:hypothetical protein [Oscillatoria acuminata]|uniref:Uncharacterized protein n=1 Tax=Oscillatoria acuminata PCC 6304 TaxID=56110 RepID=K9TDL7_9CYAN|nr:hypothetical protein [Oscillatoria acuminata]AFY80104.1 hypothetical protein Oscil6304_0353 [Oscillatoria acuminata PCC 6304]